jgi:glycosyltransferase involved in cell wall biosynthesis
MEGDRSWEADWRDLPVAVQRSFSFQKTWRHPHDFAYTTSVHIPYDTLFRLRRFRPDVVVSGEFGMRTLQAAVYKRLFDPRCRLVIWATLSSVTEVRRGTLRRFLRRWLVTVADGFLVNGRSGRAYLEQIGAPAERITPIPYVCDNAHFASAASRPPDGTRRLLVVGQLIPRKGIEQLLAVAARWAGEHADRRIELHFAGEGPLEGCLSAAGRARNLELRHLGEVDYADLPAVYGGADILVFPTLADEWGVVTNEALAAGLPVLGSVYSQAVDELIQDDVNGPGPPSLRSRPPRWPDECSAQSPPRGAFRSAATPAVWIFGPGTDEENGLNPPESAVAGENGSGWDNLGAD